MIAFVLSDAALGFGFIGVKPFLNIIIGYGIVLSIFWTTNIQVLLMVRDRKNNLIIDELDRRLQEALPSEEYENENSGLSQEEKLKEKEGKIKAMVKLEEEEEINIELSSQKPRVDAIVVVTPQEQNVMGIQQHLDSIKGRKIRTGVPVLALHQEYPGDGNAYLDVLLELKSQWAELTQKYPNLRPWQEACVVFVLHRQGIDYTRIDEAITKRGYRAAANMEQASSTNRREKRHFFIDDRDEYEGPEDQVAGKGISIGVSRVNLFDLKWLRWVHTHFSRDGDPGVSEVLEQVDVFERQHIPEPRDSSIVLHMGSDSQEGYDFENNHVEQIPAWNGMAKIGPDEVDVFEKIAENTEIRRK